MNLTENELQSLKNAKNSEKWDGICDKIKSKRDGNYPPDWYEKVLLRKKDFKVDL